MASTTRVPARFTLAHGLMILAGLITFVLITQVLKDKNQTVTVLAAAQSSNAGPVQVTRIEVDANDPLLAVLVQPEEFDAETTYVSRALVAGEPLLKSDLVRKEDSEIGRTFAFEISRSQLDGLRLVQRDLIDVIGIDESGELVYVASGRPVVRHFVPSNGLGDGGGTKAHITIGVSDLDALRIAAAWHNEKDLFIVRSTGAQPVDPSLTMDRAAVNLSLLSARQVAEIEAGTEAPATAPADPAAAADPAATESDVVETGLTPEPSATEAEAG